MRKVRKYRKTLNNETQPSKTITDRENGFNKSYKKELGRTSKLLKGTPVESKISKDPLEKKGGGVQPK